jgi:hypothetical protein
MREKDRTENSDNCTQNYFLEAYPERENKINSIKSEVNIKIIDIEL